MTRTLMAALLVALATVAGAQQAPTARLVQARYEAAATAGFEYCYFGEPFAQPQSVVLASVANDTAMTSTGGAFRSLAVGDVIYLYPQASTTAPTERKISTWTDENTIVIDAAVTITGSTTSLRARKVTCSTTTGGWFNVDGWRDKQCEFDITTLAAASAQFKVEGRYDGSMTGAELFTTAAYTATGTYTFPILENVRELRVGTKMGGAGTDLLRIMCWGSNAR